MQRERYLQEIALQFRVHPVCALLGPRQVGKTTLAKMYAQKFHNNNAAFFDLENPVDLLRLENPMLAISNIIETLIVIDEVQLRPDLFQILRVIVDKDREKHRFLILGSASRDLIKQSSETLAGRIGYIELNPLSLFEVSDSNKLWLRGGFPLSYLAQTTEDSFQWRKNYITTFLERDLPALGFPIPPMLIRRFWMMLAHYHGKTINYSDMAKSLMISDNTVRRYVDILAGTFMIRILYSWYENISKRQVKSPKIYFRDSGILNALLGIETFEQIQTNPQLGSFWEGYALEEILRYLQATSPEQAFFWATQAHAELDLLILYKTKKIGFEFKYADAPSTTRSMHSAIKDLNLDHLFVIYPGDKIFPLTDKITVSGLQIFINQNPLDKS